MRCTLRGARLVDAALDLAAGDLTFTTERIEEVGAVSSEPGSVVDAEGMIVVPGFVDVHTHGGGGFNLHTADAAEISTSKAPTSAWSGAAPTSPRGCARRTRLRRHSS